MIAANANLLVVVVIVDGPMSGDCDRHGFAVMRGSIFCLFHRLAVHLEFFQKIDVLGCIIASADRLGIIAPSMPVGRGPLHASTAQIHVTV